jgi:phosphopentomutase
VRGTLADMGQTVAENFGGTIPHGESFLGELLSREVKSECLD